MAFRVKTRRESENCCGWPCPSMQSDLSSMRGCAGMLSELHHPHTPVTITNAWPSAVHRMPTSSLRNIRIILVFIWLAVQARMASRCVLCLKQQWNRTDLATAVPAKCRKVHSASTGRSPRSRTGEGMAVETTPANYSGHKSTRQAKRELLEPADTICC